MRVRVEAVVPRLQRGYVVATLSNVAKHAPSALLVGGTVARLVMAHEGSQEYKPLTVPNVLRNLDFVVAAKSDVDDQALRVAFQIDCDEEPTPESFYWHGHLRGRGRLQEVVTLPLRLACCPRINIWAGPENPPRRVVEFELIHGGRKQRVRCASPEDVLVDATWVCSYEASQTEGMRERIRRTALVLWGASTIDQDLASDYWNDKHQRATGYSLREVTKMLANTRPSR